MAPIHAARRRGFARAFTMVEIAVVVAVVGVAAAVAVMGVSNAISHARRGQQLQAVYTQLQQIRAQHLSASASPTSCLHIVDVGGALSVEERSDCNTATTPVLHQFGSTVGLRGVSGCADNLARAVSCSDGTSLVELMFDIDLDGKPGPEGTICWGGNGRITANFPLDSDANSEVQAHLQDVSSVTTPKPTVVGQFAGTTTNPRGLLE
ncbi:MAG TPA: prepilin-type N-terminal cleavage/methylation domain-containing protein [Myxococcota bacterium]|jgi:prepilin-type N-terminal cleavage/methylation domain-containing protein